MSPLDFLNKAKKALDTVDEANRLKKRTDQYIPPAKKEEPAKPVVPPPATNPPAAAAPAPAVPAPAAVIDKERQEAVTGLAKDISLQSELRAQRRIHGDAPVEAAEKLAKLYLERAGQKPFNPVKEDEVKKFLDTYETLKDGKRAPLDAKQKEATREITWGAFSTMKGLILDNSLDAKFNLVENEGPVKGSKITILGPKK